MALDEALAEARAALASARFWYDWDWQGAEQEFKRAMELNPSLAGAHHDYGWLLIARERFDEGLAEVSGSGRKRAGVRVAGEGLHGP